MLSSGLRRHRTASDGAHTISRLADESKRWHQHSHDQGESHTEILEVLVPRQVGVGAE